MESWRLLVSGRVQGVGYRYSILRFVEQNSLSVVGFVRNLVDGRVEIVVQGRKDELQRLCDFCADGPPRAHIQEVLIDKESIALTQYSSFAIR